MSDDIFEKHSTSSDDHQNNYPFLYDLIQYIVIIITGVIILVLYRAVENLFYIHRGYDNNNGYHGLLLGGILFAIVLVPMIIAFYMKCKYKINESPNTKDVL